MHFRSVLTTLAAALLLQVAATAQTLGVGDKAPPLKVATFLRGEPVTSFEKGKPYVVEFWATWCGPCVKSIPHINALANKYKEAGLTVIGVDILENDPPKVQAFIEKMGADMGYTVARDLIPEGDTRGQSGFMVQNWMNPAGQTGIPAAFIIDREGRVAWIGHPMEMDEPLAEVMAGTFDIEEARAQAVRARELEGKLVEYNERLQSAFRESDFARAVAIVDELMALDPSFAVDYAPLRFDLLLRTKDLDAAYAYAGQLVAGPLKDNLQGLGTIAWIIVDPTRRDLARRDLELAGKAARRADVISEGKDPAVKDTLARVHFHKGELEAAIEVQALAVELAGDGPMKAPLSKVLAEYRAALEAR